MIQSRSPLLFLTTVVQAIHRSDCWISTPFNNPCTEIRLRELSITSVRATVTCWCFAGGFRTRIRTGLNSSANDSWHAASHCHTNLTWHALCASHRVSFTDLTTRRVGNLAGANLLLHSACCVRNLLCAALRDHSAGRVRHTTSDALFSPRAGCVWNLSSASLLSHRAGCIRNLLLTGFMHKRARRVRNLLHTVNRNLTANRIGNLFVADFRHHASACDRFLHGLRNPLATANCP